MLRCVGAWFDYHPSPTTGLIPHCEQVETVRRNSVVYWCSTLIKEKAKLLRIRINLPTQPLNVVATPGSHVRNLRRPSRASGKFGKGTIALQAFIRFLLPTDFDCTQVSRTSRFIYIKATAAATANAPAPIPAAYPVAMAAIPELELLLPPLEEPEPFVAFAP